MTGSPSEISELLEIARSIALEAGELIKRRRAEGVTVALTKSSPQDVVTFADKESEDLIRARLAELRPADGFLGEESDATLGSSGITWVVDPIDGTVNYLYDIPAYAVSIAAVRAPEGAADAVPDASSWTALVGCVINPVVGEIFFSAAGQGAFVAPLTAFAADGSFAEGRADAARRLAVNTDVELPQALVGTGFAYSAELRVKQGAFITGLVGQVRDIRRAGSAALDLCSVAAGRLDAYAERGLNAWDHAAGALIAREAGAVVSGLDGEAESTVLTFAANPVLVAELGPIVFGLHRDAGLPV